jgi:hypothetical protein
MKSLFNKILNKSTSEEAEEEEIGISAPVSELV